MEALTFRAEPEPAGQVDHLAGLLIRASAHEAELPRSAFMVIRIVCHILSSFLLLHRDPFGQFPDRSVPGSVSLIPISFRRGIRTAERD